MNIRKNIDYSELYARINKAFAANLSQMELYLELGRLVSGRPEKGAAVMAAEYITANYPDRTGFSPRSLRRMRDFYRMYEGHPEALAQAMKNSWTQNIVILEANLDMDARCWYLRAAWQLGWSKAELIKQIDTGAHLEKSQDLCYTDRDDLAQGMLNDEDTTEQYISPFATHTWHCVEWLIGQVDRLAFLSWSLFVSKDIYLKPFVIGQARLPVFLMRQALVRAPPKSALQLKHETF